MLRKRSTPKISIPNREDFKSFAEWTRAQYKPLQYISEYLDEVNLKHSYKLKISEIKAWRRIRAEGWNSFETVAAMRFVQKHGMLHSGEQPSAGLLNYSAPNMIEVLFEVLQPNNRRRRIKTKRRNHNGNGNGNGNRNGTRKRKEIPKRQRVMYSKASAGRKGSKR